MALPGYLEDTAKGLAGEMTKAYSAPIDTSTFAPQIAGLDPMQTSAIGRVTAGLDSYKPYLTQAQAAMTTQAGQAGPMTGAQQTAFMSPYQGQVIDETLRQYDLSRQGGIQNIKDQAVLSGNFGGGREGAQLGQYGAETLANRAGIRSGLLQQGLGQAQQQAQQAFGNQQQIANMYSGLAGQQYGLSNFQRAGLGQDIGALGQMGAMQQGQAQAQLNAQQQAAQTAAYEPYGRLGQYASGITGLAGGMPGAQYQQQGPADPWGSALSTAMGIGGLYGQIFNPPSFNFGATT